MTLIETLEASSATGPKFVAEARALLARSGLETPPGSDKKQLLVRIAAQVPAATWLEPDERPGTLEEQKAQGRWTTAVTCFYDRTNHIVVEHHVRGSEGDYDHGSWANAKRLPNAAKADALWARYAKKYRFAAELAPAPEKKPSAKTPVKTKARAVELSTDPAALQVLADAWIEAGDPRGEWIQLSLVTKPNEEQAARKKLLLSKYGGALVGPARPFVREWDFGDNGLVSRIRCEADKLAEGITEISQLNPELWVTVTSLKKNSTIEAVKNISFDKLYFVAFTMGIIGSNGGTNLSDKALVGIAPAFAGVRRIALQARGFRPDCFLPDALAAFADSLSDVAFFALDYYSNSDGPKQGLPPVADYLKVVNGHKAFKKATIVTGYDRIPKTQAALAKFG